MWADLGALSGVSSPDAGRLALLPPVRLLQLVSPALPIGAYRYSQGLERVAKLAADLELLDAPTRDVLPALAPVTLPAAYALAVRGFAVPVDAALTAYVWSWLENQVLAAVKLVPLGQVAGQRLLTVLGARIPQIAATAMTLALCRALRDRYQLAVFTNLKTGQGLDVVLRFVIERGMVGVAGAATRRRTVRASRDAGVPPTGRVTPANDQSNSVQDYVRRTKLGRLRGANPLRL